MRKFAIKNFGISDDPPSPLLFCLEQKFHGKGRIHGFPNLDVFLEKVQTAFDPPPFLEITLRFFRDNSEICVHLQ